MISFPQFKAKLFENIKKIADKSRQIYQRKCNKQTGKCNSKIYDECKGTDYRQCLSPYFYPPQGCLDYGVSVSRRSGSRFPYNVDPDTLTNNQKLFVCASWQLDDTFKEIKKMFGTAISRQYIGTYYGYFRVYPAHEQSNFNGICTKDYDPRVRPWYVAATTGSKNILIVLDVSKSMQGARFSMVKLITNFFLNTLGIDDFFGVIKFSDEAQILNADQILVRASSQNTADMISKISKIAPNGATNYQKAFNKTKQLLQQSHQKQAGFRCETPSNIVIFLTDGNPTSGANTTDSLISIINSWNDQFKIKLFTYGIGNQFSNQTLKNLSCSYEGIFTSISDADRDTDIINKMKVYFQYTQSGVNISEPVWSPPFIDAVTGQTLLTVSLPIYYNQQGVQKVLGAAAVAVPITTLYRYGIKNENQAIQKLVSTTPCSALHLAECQIERIRYQKCRNDCGNEFNNQSCTFTVSDSIIGNPPIKGDVVRYACCGISVNGLIVIIVVLISVIVIGLSIFLGYRKYQNYISLQKEKQNETQTSDPNSNSNSNTNPNANNQNQNIQHASNTMLNNVEQQNNNQINIDNNRIERQTQVNFQHQNII